MIDQTSMFRQEAGVSPAILGGLERIIFLEWDINDKKETKAKIIRPRSITESKEVLVPPERVEILDTWRVLVFDTETTGLPKNWRAPISDFDNWPRIVELAFGVIEIEVATHEIKSFEIFDYIIEPDGFEIPKEASDVHGITDEKAWVEGVPISYAINKFSEAIRKADILAAHNLSFDRSVLGSEILRIKKEDRPELLILPSICTKEASTSFCEIPALRGGFKWPKLEELYSKLFEGRKIENQHRADGDVRALGECFAELCKKGIIKIEKEVSK